MRRAPGKVSALAAGTRASTARQVSHRCLGSGGARAAAGLPAEKQPLPLDRASPANTGSSPRGGFRGTTLRKWVQTRSLRKAERPGKPCAVRTGSVRGALSLQPPDPSSHHLIRLRDKSCAHTCSPNTDFPSLFRNRLFLLHTFVKRFF